MKIPGKRLLSRIFRNCADPKGALGRVILRMMNFGHRPVYAWTFDHCPLADGMRALDVGCGGGGAIVELSRRFSTIRVDGIDASAESVAMCRRRVAARVANPGEIVQGVADALPMADSAYDVAYAIETVYFWPDLCAGLREMKRVLKCGGVAAVSVECFDPARAGVWKDLVGHMEVRTPEQIAQAFRDAGFANVSIFKKGENRPTWCGVVSVIGRKPIGN